MLISLVLIALLVLIIKRVKYSSRIVFRGLGLKIAQTSAAFSISERLKVIDQYLIVANLNV